MRRHTWQEELEIVDRTMKAISGVTDLAGAAALLVGEAADDAAGSSVAGAGDVDGDGLADVLVGARDNDAGGTSAGAAYLLYGPLSGQVGLASADARLLGEGSLARAGAAVAGAGDVDGDGAPDLLVGAPGQGDAAGAAYLVFGLGL